jgi:hypothetical protein
MQSQHWHHEGRTKKHMHNVENTHSLPLFAAKQTPISTEAQQQGKPPPQQMPCPTRRPLQVTGTLHDQKKLPSPARIAACPFHMPHLLTNAAYEGVAAMLAENPAPVLRQYAAAHLAYALLGTHA